MRLTTKYIGFKSISLAALIGFFMISSAYAANIESRIFKFQQKVAKIGNAKAQYKLAYMHEIGRGTEKDLNQATLWYKKSASQNFRAAKHRLVFINVKTKGFKAKHKMWLTSLINDANKGDDDVQFLLANMYEEGIGVKRNLKQAHRYYKLSTAKGNADAESQLFRIVQKINATSEENEKQKAAKLAAKKAAAKKQQAKKDAEAKKQKAKQLAAEKQRKRRESDRKKVAAKKQKQAMKNKALAKKQAEAKKQANKPAAITTAENKEEVFESDLCSGAAARFRTQCN